MSEREGRRVRRSMSVVVIMAVIVLASACQAPFMPGWVVTVTPAAGGLPPPTARTEPVVQTFKGCPPEGDGGDPALNRLKNRVDPAPITPVNFSAIFDLTWPKGIERRDRASWTPADRAAVAQYEGLPVSVEAYLFDGKESGMESSNCHSVDYNDWHVWMIADAHDDRTRSIVVEPTPRTLDLHAGWTLKKIKAIAKADVRVRVTGWTLLDPEHPDQVGKTRGTIWEIHPITGWDVQVNGQWVPLDNYEP